MSTPHPRAFALEDSVFTIPEAAQFLRISRSTVYALIAAKKLRSFHIPGAVRTLVAGDELKRFIADASAAS